MQKMYIVCFAVLAMLSAAMNSPAQEVQEGGTVMIAEVFDGDTLPVKYLNTVVVVGERKFMSKKDKAKWSRLQYNVKKVYPYAKLAGELLNKYEVPLDTITNERERKKYFKLIEDELRKEFDDDLREMTTTQGMILIKLVDRETRNTSYEIVQEFRGNFSAFFWQGISRMFGQDLKSRYDPNGADKEIESIIVLIESGVI